MKAWRTTEIAALAEHYPRGGAVGVRRHVQRTERAIYAKAHQLGLRIHGNRSRRRTWTADDHIDGAIAAAIPRCIRRGDVAKLADRLGRPRWWVSKRASALGLVVPRTRMPAWTAAEDLVLYEMAGRHLGTIARVLRAQGPARTETAIAVRLKRLGESCVDHTAMSACALARLLGMDGKTITRWIACQGLPAQRVGDQWRIDTKRLRRWIADHAALVDLRKVDQLWFIEMACGAAAP